MAQTFNFTSEQALDLESYMAWISDNVDEHDVDSVIASAEMLYRLSLNKTLFNNVLLDPLKRCAEMVQPENQYTDATFIMGYASNGGLMVRANLWKAPEARAGSEEYERELYSYDIPHDHNFDFLTVGYYGPGYTTNIYSYDRNLIELVVGAPVELTFLETTRLEVGKVIFFEKSKDIHTQRPPESPSISLNMICVTEEQSIRQQCFFDVEKQTLSGFASGPTASRVQIIKMAANLGIDDAVEPLIDIVRRHACDRTRAAAIRSVVDLDSSQLGNLRTICGNKSGALIKSALEAAEVQVSLV